MRKLIGVNLPIAQAGFIVVAWMPIAKPAIVEQEGFGPQTARAVEERYNPRFVEVKTGCFPIVEQDRPGFRSIAQAMMPGPSMEVAADFTFTAVAPRPEHGRCGKELFRH